MVKVEEGDYTNEWIKRYTYTVTNTTSEEDQRNHGRSWRFGLAMALKVSA